MDYLKGEIKFVGTYDLKVVYEQFKYINNKQLSLNNN